MTHQVIDKEGKVKHTGTHLECKRKRHGFDRVEAIAAHQVKVKPHHAPKPKVHTHQVVDKDGKITFTGTHLECKRKRHGYSYIVALTAEEKAAPKVKALPKAKAKKAVKKAA